jgi:hypothetical protein
MEEEFLTQMAAPVEKAVTVSVDTVANPVGSTPLILMPATTVLFPVILL